LQKLLKPFMEHLSQRITSLEESATLKMSALTRELKSKGIDVIDMSIGEPDFPTPQHIKDAAIQAIHDGYTQYPPVAGYPELRKNIAAKLKRDNNLDFTADQIVVSTGAKQSLINVLLCLINPGEEVIIPAPYWVSYAAMTQLAEGKMVNIFAGVEQDFKITAAQLEAAITPKTRAFLFSSPCNPTGSVYTKEELKSLAQVFAKYPEIYIISDEIYEYINFVSTHESIAQFEEIRERVIVVNGFSKGFAMTGWRLGYIAAPLWLAKACNKLQGQFTSGTCSIAQKAAETAISADLKATYEMRDAFKRRRGLIVGLLKEIEGFKVSEPTGAFYVFPDVSAYFGKSYNGESIRNAEDFAMFILAEANVALVTGDAFGNGNCVRLSFATADEKIVKAVKQIKNALAKLN
jgi:aspartate aminotransferase